MKKQLIIRNNIIPFRGFAAINIFGVIFARKDAYIGERTINHEGIHTEQIKEITSVGAPLLFLLLIFITKWWIALPISLLIYYILYVLEWFIRLFLKGNAYKNISFEREAYSNDNNFNYLKNRKKFAFLKYIIIK